MRLSALFFKFGFAAFAVLFMLCATAVEKRSIQLLDTGKSIYREVEESDSMTIQWVAPYFEPGYKRFELLFHSQMDTTWIPIDTAIVPSDSPQVVVHRNSIQSNDSVFYFGIRSVDKNNAKSDIHSTSDSSASPPGGWILFWPK